MTTTYGSYLNHSFMAEEAWSLVQCQTGIFKQYTLNYVITSLMWAAIMYVEELLAILQNIDLKDTEISVSEALLCKPWLCSDTS